MKFAQVAIAVLYGGVALADAYSREQLQAQAKDAANDEQNAMAELQQEQGRMRALNQRIAERARREIAAGDVAKGNEELQKVQQITGMQQQIDEHLQNVATFSHMADSQAPAAAAADRPPSLLQQGAKHLGSRALRSGRGPEDDLAQEMTHDLEMNFNKIAPFGKEDTAKELQDHAAKTQDTLVDAVENAEVAEIKRAVFRALTRLRAATIKEFDTIARLETQAIDAYNDAHHYRAENPLAHLHEDEAPVETDKLKSFH